MESRRPALASLHLGAPGVNLALVRTGDPAQEAALGARIRAGDSSYPQRRHFLCGPFLASVGLSTSCCLWGDHGRSGVSSRGAPPLPPHAHTCTHTPEVPSTGLFGPADSLHCPSAHPRRHGHPVLGAFLPSGTCRTWPLNGTIPGSPLAQRKSALSLPSCLVTRVWRQ